MCNGLLVDIASESGLEYEKNCFIRFEKDSNLADSKPVFMRIGRKRLDVEVLDIASDEAREGIFEAQT